MSVEIHNEIHGEIETFKRGLLKESLEKCTSDQQAFFDRLFPSGVPEDKLVGAIDLCRRTIKKNKLNLVTRHHTLSPPPKSIPYA